MSESIEQVIDTNAQSVTAQSSEDRFFGVTSQINTSSSNEIEVEIVNDVPEEDRRNPKVDNDYLPVDDETVDKEITKFNVRKPKIKISC